MNAFLIIILWIALLFSALMVISHNLSKMHMERDGIWTNKPTFPKYWFAFFCLCLTLLVIHYMMNV